MKTVKNIKTSAIKRVKDAEAHKLVDQLHEFKYVPKSEWKKELGRPNGPAPVE